MKKIVLILMAMMMVAPSFAQKMTKAEKQAAAKLAYEAALESINNKTWVLVPDTYALSNGDFETNIDNGNFLSCENGDCFSQGAIVCDNSYTNVSTPSEYEVTVDKKGNVTLRIVVNGNYWKGTYKITMRNGNNNADVVFNPNKGTTRRFSGPIVPLAGASYNKRANPK
ncbi:MAG: DUF4251 domain-containing protein [Bacteroidales bacterium]|nr:DUF4251 domain-containing protein [Bacteroidales bacterium]